MGQRVAAIASWSPLIVLKWFLARRFSRSRIKIIGSTLQVAFEVGTLSPHSDNIYVYSGRVYVFEEFLSCRRFNVAAGGDGT